MENLQLSFVRLSGWPVFFAVILGVVLLSWIASVLRTRAASRWAVQTMVFAVVPRLP